MSTDTTQTPESKLGPKATTRRVRRKIIIKIAHRQDPPVDVDIGIVEVALAVAAAGFFVHDYAANLSEELLPLPANTIIPTSFLVSISGVVFYSAATSALVLLSAYVVHRLSWLSPWKEPRSRVDFIYRFLWLLIANLGHVAVLASLYLLVFTLFVIAMSD